MATEKQLKALEKWLSGELRDGEGVGEMPFEVCSDALSRLSEASKAYKEKKAERGVVKKTKVQIADELRERGFIGELTKALEEEDCQENQAEQDETKVEPGTIEKYVGILAQITQQVEAEERIPPTEKGYAINNVFQAVTRDMRSELIAELDSRKRGL